MDVKTLCKYFICLAIFFHELTIAQESSVKLNPYIGVDTQWKRLAYQQGFGNNLFKKTRIQGNGYVGIEIGNFFGIEGGFESTLSKSEKKTVLNPGDSILGFVIPIGDPSETHLDKYTLKGWHINLLGFSPWILEDCSLRFLGGIGFSRKRISITDNFFAEGGVPLNNPILRTFATKRTLLRLSAGAQKMLTEHLGVRLTAVWENTNKFDQLKSKERPNGVTTASLKNSVAGGLGVFARF